jgi:hypothetical protein
MLIPTSQTLRDFVDSWSSNSAYKLSDITLDIPDAATAIFKARLLGPVGAQAWARAWLWNEIDKTLAEAASPPVPCGEIVTLTVQLKRAGTPVHASMRIESAPLRTEHVVQMKLPQKLHARG